LQSEVAELDQKDVRARELAHELARLEMNLARARELNSRIEQLRAALASTANAVVVPVRKARSNQPTPLKSSTTAPTPFVNLEEISK
jgi:lipid A disaccharide synthetase